MKDIVVVNVNWLGDVIFSSPVFKALRKKYPDARIVCLAHPRVKGILDRVPNIDEIILLDEKGKHWAPWGKWLLIQELRRKKFDAAFLLHRSFTRALLVFLAGIPQRIGYDTKKRGMLLTHRVALPEAVIHRSAHYLKVIENFGVKVDDRTTELTVDDKDRQRVDEMLKNDGISNKDFMVILNPGGNWDLKRWPKSNFAECIERLAQEFNVKMVISGAPKDVALAQTIKDSAKIDVSILAGQTSLNELIALMARADLMISGDSGPLHIANSVGTTTIGLFGPTRPEVTGPLGKGKSVIIQNDVGCNQSSCYFLECPHQACMWSITVDQVIDAMRPFLKDVVKRQGAAC